MCVSDVDADTKSLLVDSVCGALGDSSEARCSDLLLQECPEDLFLPSYGPSAPPYGLPGPPNSTYEEGVCGVWAPLCPAARVALVGQVCGACVQRRVYPVIVPVSPVVN